MALSGNFYKYVVDQFGVYCEWKGQQSYSGNYTDITLNVYLRYYTLVVAARSDSIVSINGVQETYTSPAINDLSSTNWHFQLIKTKTVRVKHNADGKKQGVPLSASWRMDGVYSGVQIGTITASTYINLDTIPTYTLSMSAGSGSNISVSRTSSGYGSTGALSNGARLYYNDRIKVLFSPSSNYAISTHTVNGSTFTSGNTYTVAGNVSIVASAVVLSASVGATDANVDGTSIVAVVQHNNSYYHSLQYKFGTLSGYIDASGETQDSEIKIKSTSIPFKIPTVFYTEMPNSRTAKCTITCRTYATADSITIIGSPTTCTITITATGEPQLSGGVYDINPITAAITGDTSVLIRYKSTAFVVINAQAQNSATIVSKYVNGNIVEGNITTIANVSDTKFTITVTDSRGYSTSTVLNPTVIDYQVLTLNPRVFRTSPTENSIYISFSGDMYTGGFGDSQSSNNALTLKYRYKKSDDSDTFSQWYTVPANKVLFANNSYSSDGNVLLEGNYDYRNEYVLEVQASDGISNSALSSVTKTVTVYRGVPVFDWGKEDFNFNVPVSINRTTINDFVIEEGVSGIWSYRKWNNGTAECWCVYSGKVSTSNSMSGVYYSDATAIDYPPIFLSPPTYTVSGGSNNVINWVRKFATNRSDKCTFITVALSTQTDVGIDVNIYAIGSWQATTDES